MVFINSIGFIAITIILCATICNGKNVYDDIDTHGSDGIVEVKRPSFYVGTRYGRSNGIQSGLRIAPRRDFHFLRYGKRANNDQDQDIQPIQCYEPVRDYVLTCSFTGIRDFYRCWKGQENKFYAVDEITSNAVDEVKQQQQQQQQQLL